MFHIVCPKRSKQLKARLFWNQGFLFVAHRICATLLKAWMLRTEIVSMKVHRKLSYIRKLTNSMNTIVNKYGQSQLSWPFLTSETFTLNPFFFTPARHTWAAWGPVGLRRGTPPPLPPLPWRRPPPWRALTNCWTCSRRSCRLQSSWSSFRCCRCLDSAK